MSVLLILHFVLASPGLPIPAEAAPKELAHAFRDGDITVRGISHSGSSSTQYSRTSSRLTAKGRFDDSMINGNDGCDSPGNDLSPTDGHSRRHLRFSTSVTEVTNERALCFFAVKGPFYLLSEYHLTAQRTVSI